MEIDTNTAENKPARPHKRRRAKRDHPYPDIEIIRCYLTETPVELLANILQYVYPIDLLALAHTNRHLYKTLRHGQQTYIWKMARKQFPHAKIPDPVRFSEIELATLLFGTGKCSICKAGREVPLASLSYPMRVCKDNKCKRAFEALWAAPPPELSTLVYGTIPSERLSLSSTPYAWPPHDWMYTGIRPNRCKKTDLAPVLQDIRAGLGQKELESKYKTTFGQTTDFNEFIADLHAALVKLHTIDRSKSSEIQRFVKFKLSKLDFKGACLENSTTYISERRRLRRLCETFDEKAWDSIPPRAVTDNPEKPSLTVGKRIIQEMQSMHDAAQRRQAEENLRKARGTVKEHWNQLKNVSGPSSLIVPRLNEFNALPVVHALLKPKASEGEVDDLKTKDSTISKLVGADVATWEERTRAQFRKTLQIPIPRKNQLIDPDAVPPLDRVTSLFECTKCKQVGLELAQEGTLTFRSAVKHRCKGAQSKGFQWRADLFQPDPVGIQVARRAVESSGQLEIKLARKHMDSLGPCFLCKICTTPIYLTFGNLIGHMKRHGISNVDESFEYQAATPDLDLKQLSSSKGMVEARRRGSKKGYNSTPGSQDFFVCRHCNKSLLWNALVSHVKEKHKFSDIRDEDFYPKPKPQPVVADTDSID